MSDHDRKCCNKNMFSVKHIVKGNIGYYITEYECGSGDRPLFSMPFLKPNGEYGHIQVKHFVNNFEDRFRVIMYETTNKYLNRLFEHNKYWNIHTKPGKSVQVYIKYSGVTLPVKLKSDHFVLCNGFVSRKHMSYESSKKEINDVLDSTISLLKSTE